MTEHPKTFADLYPSRFIKPDHLLKGPRTYTIKSYHIEVLETEKGPQKKVIVSFHETPMEWVCPTVNGVCLRAMFGDDLDDWIDKRVTLYATDKIMQLPSRKGQPAIRVYGSPDIAEPVRCEWTPARRRPLIQVLQPVKLDEPQPAQPTASGIVPAASKAIAEATNVEALARIMQRVAEHAKAGHISLKEVTALTETARAREDALQPPAQPEPTPEPKPPAPAAKPTNNAQALLSAFDALPPQKRKQARDSFFARFTDLRPGTLISAITTDDHVSALAEIIAATGD